MFLRASGNSLACEHIKRRKKSDSGCSRIYNVLNVSAESGSVRRSKSCLVFLNLSLSLLTGIAAACKLLAVKNSGTLM